MAPRLARIRVFPVKSLDPLELESVGIASGVCLSGDREFALFDAAGRAMNAKRLGSSIVSIRATYSNAGRSVLLEKGPHRVEFDLDGESAEIEGWFGRVLGRRVSLSRNAVSGHPDDQVASGPTVAGSASIAAVAERFALPTEEVRRRFRANLEIEGLQPFEEDLLFGPPGSPRRFRIGEVKFLGTNPCLRCVVPTLDSRDGSVCGRLSARRFADFRRRHLFPAANFARYTGSYRFAVNTRLPPRQAGRELRVNDPLVLLPENRRVGAS